MVLTFVCALFMTLVAFGNITDFGTNQAFVEGVFEIDTTFQDPDLMWRSIDSALLQNVGYVFIIACEAGTALLLWVGLVEWFAMWQSSQWNGLEPALRYYLFAVTTRIYATIALRQLAEDRRGAPDEPSSILGMRPKPRISRAPRD